MGSNTKKDVLWRQRSYATMIDLVLVEGFCLYFAKVTTLLFLLPHLAKLAQYDAAVGERIFQHAYSYGFLFLWGVSSVWSWTLYRTVMVGSLGKSVGMALLGLQVVDQNGKIPSAENALKRALSFGLWSDEWSSTRVTAQTVTAAIKDEAKLQDAA